jgi:lipopolysaccharide transport system permease protein
MPSFNSTLDSLSDAAPAARPRPLSMPSRERLVISSRQRATLGARELWAYRELLYFFVWRDLKVRYRQTTLGVLWVLLQPLASMAIFTVLFGWGAGFSTYTPSGVPYALFVFCGMLPWLFFSTAVTEAMGSLLGNQSLITKVYFPRLAVPLASVTRCLVDLSISLLLLLAIMPFFGVWPTWRFLALPLVLFFLALLAVGVGSALAALTVKYRDVRYVVPFMLQLWFYVSPIVFPLAMLPEQWRWVLKLNPLAGLLEGFRIAVLGGEACWNARSLVFSCSLSVVALLVGVGIFRTLERDFADVI